ncbi:MAG: uroporphyrinogen-III synthase [Candidatus Caenarcaniphilales bacterium]|nr:uroporphyrinogen-III synthase [Candidatus Caenarcaniphilales bacterium]
MNTISKLASILLTLPKHKLDQMKDLLGEQYIFFDFPLLELIPLDPLPAFPRKPYDLIILSSSFAAELCFQHYCKELRPDQAFATVGPSVSEVVHKNGFKVLYQPKSNFSVEGLMPDLQLRNHEKIEENKFLLIGTQDTALLKYSGALQTEGIKLDHLTIYNTQEIPNPDWHEWESFRKSDPKLKCICLTSPRAIRYFVALFKQKDLPQDFRFICLGDQSANLLKGEYDQVHQAAGNSYQSLAESIRGLSEV